MSDVWERLLRTLVPVAILAVALVACGGDGDANGGDSGAVALTKRLAPSAGFYAAVDIAAIKDDLGLPEDADPRSLTEDADPALAALSAPALAATARLTVTDPQVSDALDLGRVTAGASSLSDGDGDGRSTMVSVLATRADTGEIGSALGDLGYQDHSGVLERSDPGDPAFRLDDGIVVAGSSPEAVRALLAEPAELPQALLGELAGQLIVTSPGPGCTDGYGFSADADGSGEIALEIDGGFEANRLQVQEANGFTFGEPRVDGDVVTVPISSDDASDGAPAAQRAAALFLVDYDCG